MRLHIIFCFIFMLIGHSCSTKSEMYKYTLAPDRAIVIPLGTESLNFSNCLQFFENEGTNYLSVLNERTNTIEIYNIDHPSKINSIKIHIEGANAFGEVMTFHMIDLDTFFLNSLALREIAIANGTGDIIKRYSYRKDNNGRSFKPTIPFRGERPLLIGKIVYIGQQYGAMQNAGILNSDLREESPLAMSLNMETGECHSYPLLYPEELIGKDIAGMDVIREVGYKGVYVYHFGSIPKFFLTSDLEKFSVVPMPDNLNIKLNDSFYPSIHDIQVYMTNLLQHDQVLNIHFDVYRECYYMIVREHTEVIDKNMDLFLKTKYPKCCIYIFDRGLKLVGKTYFHDDSYSFQMTFIGPEGLYISEDHPNNPDFDEDYMRFRLFKLEKL